MKTFFATDAQALGFLLPQQLRINTEIDMQVYPAFNYADYLFVNTDGGMWAQGSVFFSGDVAGQAEWFNTAGFDMPYADISTTQFLQSNYLAAIGYQWHRGELEQAAQLGRDLSSEKAEAARMVAESRIYALTMTGDTLKNLTGIFNDANVPTATVPNDGTGPSTTFPTKTADQVLRDINAVLIAPFNASGETLMADTLVMATTALQELAARRVGDTTETILAFILRNNWYTLQTGRPLRIFGSRSLETAGAGNTRRMVAYENTRRVLQLYLPGPHTFFPLWQKGSFTWEVPGLFNFGGVEIRRPKGMAYRDGI